MLALTMGVLPLTGVVELWMVFALALGLGLVTVVDNPTRQSFVAEMVGPADLQNGISLNSAVFTFTRILGPAIAGALILTVGLAACFLVNASRSSRDRRAGGHAPVRAAPGRTHSVACAGRSARGSLRVDDAATSLAAGADGDRVHAVVQLQRAAAAPLPVLLRRGRRDVRAVPVGDGRGVAGGALAMANRRRPSPQVLAWAAAGMGAAMVGVGLAPSVGVAFGVLAVIGFASMVFMATGNSMMQVASAPSMRGRVMSIYAMVFLGSTPIGGPLMGWLSEWPGRASRSPSPVSWRS